MKNANERIPASRMLSIAVWIFCRSSRLTMSLRISSDSVSIPIASIQQPARRSRCTNAGSVRLSARALPNHCIGSLRAISSSQNAENDLHVQRDCVAPQIEEVDAELAVAALDLVDELLGAALAELVPLVDRARRRNRTSTGSRGSFRR